MALELVQTIVSIVADYTITPLTRQISYAFKYKNKVGKLRSEVEKLKDEKESLENSVGEATRKGEEIEKKVEHWLIRVDKAMGEANDLISNGEEQVNKKRCFIGLCSNLKVQYELGRGAAKGTLAIVELRKEAKFDRISHLPPPQQMVASSVIGREGLPSRLSILKEVMDLLKDPGLNMIGVFGMGGVGKTTLVREVHRLAVEEKLFDVVVMTDVSETPEIKKIQGLIADAVGLKFDEEADSIRAWRLHERLMKEKRILVILDNIWARIELEEIGIPSGNSHKGCKILLTSRYENVLLCEMRAQQVRRLDALTDEEAKNLFEINAGDGNSTLQLIAADIAKKCGGLPLLLVTIASSLKNKGPHAWRDTLMRLSRFDNEELYAKLYLVLELTYDRLPGEEVKSLFLLCALLGTSYVSILDLLKYSMGLGLFKYVETVEDARDRMYTLIDDLKACCLLLESDKNDYVKIHDIVREVAVSIAAKAQQVFTIRDGDVLKEWPDKNVLGLCTKFISLPHCDISTLPERLECPEAEFLYLQTDRASKIPHSVFEGCGKLRILNFRGISLTSLPPSLNYLINLHTLCLDGCSLCDISAIGVLKKLEILSLRFSDIVELPRETEQLTQLRILDLSSCYKLKAIPANVISRLSLLEELYIDSFVEWEFEGIKNYSQVNVSLAEVKYLSRLRTLAIKIPDAKMLPKGLFSKHFGLERFWISVGNVSYNSNQYKTSRMLNLQFNMPNLEDGVEVLLNKTEELNLNSLRGINNLVYDLNSGGFSSLKHLNVNNCFDIQYIIQSVKQVPDCNAFSILETLRLERLTSLEKICHGPVATKSFSKLRKLIVSGCHRLKNLFSISLFKGLLELQEMEVIQCHNMEEIITEDGYHDKDDENQVVELTQLRSLKLEGLPKLTSFCYNRTPTRQKQLTADQPISSQEALSAGGIPMPLFNEMVLFPNLEDLQLSSITCKKIWHEQVSATSSSLTNLIVKNCRNLKHLFPFSVAKTLLRLKKLEISYCDFMEVIGYTDGLEEDRGMNTEICFLELDFLKLTNLPNVIGFCNWCPIKCHSLRHLLVENCSSLKTIVSCRPIAASIFNEGTKLMNLQRNQHIDIQSLFHEMSLKKLRKLEVRDCGSIKEVFELKGAFGDKALVGLMSSLSEMLLFDLPRLRYICNEDPRGMLDLNKLKVLKIQYCNSLNYAFTLSLASHLQQVQEIEIKNCIMMQGLIQKEGADEAALDHKKIFFSSLKKITVIGCPRMRMFVSTVPGKLELIKDGGGKGQKPSKDELDHWSTAPCINPEFFPNLEVLSLDGMATMMMISQQPLPTMFACQINLLEICSYHGRSLNFLQKFQNIKEIVVRDSSLIEILTNGGICDGEEDVKWTLPIKNLELNGISDLKHIWKEDSQLDPILRNLETLKVSNCHNLANLAPSSPSFKTLTILDVHRCTRMIDLISSAAAKSLVQLITMRISLCYKLSQIIADEPQHGTAQEQEEIIFSKLKTLELIDLHSLNSFCTGNYTITFPSLELVFVQGCPKLRTFCFGGLTTPMLESVQVTSHSYSKRKHWEGNLNATIQQLYLGMEMVIYGDNKIALSELSHLNELFNALNQPKVVQRFYRFYKLVVDVCAFGSNAIASPVLQLMKFLKVLVVEKCDSVVQLFDMEALRLERGNTLLMSQLQELHLIDLPNLRDTLNNDAKGILCFKNLKVLKVDNCSSLTKICSLSMALGLVQLQNIEVKRCNWIEAIVTKDEEEQPTWDRTIFPSLISIKLEHLPSLTSVYSGSNDVKFPSLKRIDVLQCPKILIHASKSSREEENKEAICKEKSNLLMFPNLEELSFGGKAIMMIAQSPPLIEIINSKLTSLKLHSIRDKSLASFLSSFLEKLAGSLNKLCIENCFLEELFKYGGGRVGGGDIKEEDASCATPIMRKLELKKIRGLKHLWSQGFQLDSVVLEHLETLKVEYCYDLIKFAPSSSTASFQNLATLQVSYCNEIMYLVSPSTAKSMVQLATMIIKDCAKLMGIVVDHNRQNGTMRDEGEIIFHKLKTLELTDLHNLTSFCSDSYAFAFPSLEQLIVQNCPNLRTFSTGILKAPKMESVENNYGTTKKSYWEGNLNATIQWLYAEMGGFDGLEELKLSAFPHLKEKWYDQSQFKFLSNLEELVMDNCALFSYALSLNQLQYLNSLSKLNIEHCDSLEQVFDLETLEPDEGQLGLISMSNLYELCLTQLPKLRQVWSIYAHKILDMQNLGSLIIHDCSSLTNIFTLSVAFGLVQLQRIEIKRCHSVQEIIAREGEEKAAGTKIVFPSLESIILESLPNLQSFYSGSGIMNCPSLKEIDVVECPQMKIISSLSLREQDSSPILEREKGRLCKIDFGSSFACFFADKVVITSLEQLRLEWGVFMKEIWHQIYQQQFFDELKVIELTHVPDDWDYLPSGFLQKLPHLENLVLSDAFVEELLPGDSDICKEKHTMSLANLTKLKLFKLPKLKHLVDSQTIQNFHLQVLEVLECSRLKVLVPSSVSFQNLITLKVWKCNGLVNLMTPSTARSLVNLVTMTVHECERVQEIILANEGDTAEDGICFNQLKHLVLNSLPCLRSFHSGNLALYFPSLVKVIVGECPKMRTFSQEVVSSPQLWRIQTVEDIWQYDQDFYHDKVEWHWDGSLNNTIKKLFMDRMSAEKI